MSKEVQQAKALRLMVVGAIAEAGDLTIVQEVQQKIEAIVAEAEKACEGVGRGALLMAYLDQVIASED